MRPSLPPNPQTIAGLYSHGHKFGGGCWNCSPPRRLKISMPELIALKGPDYLVRHSLKRLVCKECRAVLDLQIVSAKEHEPFELKRAYIR
jgi:hypothetical protein